jgi:hypothetical protein
VSLYDDALRLADASPMFTTTAQGGQDVLACTFCDGELSHASDCPWLSIPRIAQAINAAEHARSCLLRGKWAEARDVLDANLGPP